MPDTAGMAGEDRAAPDVAHDHNGNLEYRDKQVGAWRSYDRGSQVTRETTS